MGLQTRPIPNDTNTEYISVSTVQLYNMTKAVLLCQPVFNITKIFVVPSHSPFFFFFFFLLQFLGKHDKIKLSQYFTWMFFYS